MWSPETLAVISEDGLVLHCKCVHVMLRKDKHNGVSLLK